MSRFKSESKKTDENKISCALELERHFSQFKLWANLIPSNTWYSNLRKVLSSDEWDRVRKIVYKRQDYECYICGNFFREKYTNKNRKHELHCHEDWIYNYDAKEQKLNKLIALCYMCHMFNHLGFCQVKLIPDGILTWGELSSHWSEVNNVPKEIFEEKKKLAFDLWRTRSRIDWKVVDFEGNLIEEIGKLTFF